MANLKKMIEEREREREREIYATEIPRSFPLRDVPGFLSQKAIIFTTVDVVASYCCL
jgi:hypothetical protein